MNQPAVCGDVYEINLHRLLKLFCFQSDSLFPHRLISLPEELMQQPLAQHFMLDGIAPQLKVERNRAAPEYQTTPIGHPDSVHKRWGLVAMEMLRNVAEVRGTSSSREVKVRGDMRPGDRVVILCDSEGGEVSCRFLPARLRMKKISRAES